MVMAARLPREHVAGSGVLALSPHLDDAVLSVGGCLARLASRGERVVVATFYTSGPPAGTARRALRGFADLERRRREDADALAVVGATPLWLGLVERAFRTPALSSPLQTFATPREELWPHLDELERVTAALLDEHPGALVLVPLAVGHHVDHVAVFAAACRALAACGALGRARFYEDAYAVCRAARARHFVTRSSKLPLSGANELSSAYAALLSALVWAGRRGRPPEAWLPSEVREAGWRFDPIPLDGFSEVKERAIRSYASQLGAMGGADRYLRLLARQARQLGGAEATWRAEPARAGGTA
jgi:LmbE family N-acetylglucosaminyl deacetylase